NLQKHLNGTNVYKRLTDVFRTADDRYNSGLFHFKDEKERGSDPDTLTLGLKIDDDAIKEILKNLYFPDSPYEFSVLPADILGQVYEQFLGKVIRLTDGHRAKIEEKPEVRKAGGVYYTPKYIVDYIVKNTVGKLVEGKRPDQVAKLRILDPACGSGSFLIQAYQYLLDWHLAWYIQDGAEKHAKGRPPRLFLHLGKEWRLTTKERKRVLLNNIYGVDIDSQAVEVTKLSLLLKVLEGESPQSLTYSFEMFHERVLPDLQENIKCGNSLVAPDFYVGKQLGLLSDEDRYRVNAFDWTTEFPEISGQKGFDAVIGNPPYIRMEAFKELKNYLKDHYRSHDERSDLYAYFLERGNVLLKNNGWFGMIVSNKFLRANYGKPLRDYLKANASIEEIVDFAGLPVFSGATVRTIVLVATKPNAARPIRYSPPMTEDAFNSVEAGLTTIDEVVNTTSYEVESASLNSEVWSFSDQQTAQIVAKIGSRSVLLKDYCKNLICMGIKSGLTKAFVIDNTTRKEILKVDKNAEEIIKPFLNGRDVRRYHTEPVDQYILYMYHGVDIKRYPGVERHLRPFKSELENRATRQEWYELQQPQMKFTEYLKNPKIIFPDIATT